MLKPKTSSVILEILKILIQNQLQTNTIWTSLSFRVPRVAYINQNISAFKIFTQDVLKQRIRLSKYIFYNFWKLLGSNSDSLFIG